MRGTGKPEPFPIKFKAQPIDKKLMANEKTARGFQYTTPKENSTPIITTGLATMGGASGSQFGLIKPDAEGTTLFAKINGYFFDFFQAGVEWGNKRGIKSIEAISDSETVHAEEYLIAALIDSWDLLTTDGIIKQDVAPSITIKITKSPCSGCAPQLVEFVSNNKCSIRIKAAQLWGHKSHKYPYNVTALGELGSAGITVIPWKLVEKVGKQRKTFTTHELGFLSKEKFSEEDINTLHKEYNILREALGLKEDEQLSQRLKDYKSKTLNKEAYLAYSKDMASKITTDIGGKLSKMEAELDSLKVALEKAEQKPTRSSPRQKVIDKTNSTTKNQKAQIVAQQQKIERKQATLEKRKEYYETMQTN
jgi:hypothetical protein